MSLLEVAGLNMSFAGLQALSGITFNISKGEIVGLIGPNGAGKTTLLNCVSRLYEPDSGRIVLNGADLLRAPMHGIAKLGLARTFQNLEVFASATVLENVAVNCMWRYRSPLAAELLGLPSARRLQDSARRHARRVLEEFGLLEYESVPVSSLPFGLQKYVELARAMASQPILLLLDEPAAGLNPGESLTLGERIRALRDRFAVTIVLIEHDMRLVMEVCDRLIVLDHGEVIDEGSPAAVRSNPAVLAAYLGVETDRA